MPKRFIALVLAVVMTSQMITPVISYGEDNGTGASTASVEDSVSSGSGIVIEESTEITAEPTEITAEPTEIHSSSGSDLWEIISADFSEDGTCGDNLTYTYDSDTYTLTISGTGDMADYSSDEDYTNASPWYSVSSQITSVIIEDGVTSIGNYAFYGCDSLTSITIPDNVTNIGNHAFYDCSALTSVNVPDSVTSIGNYAFYYCINLISITMPDSMTSIGSGAFFYCNKLTSITIPDGLTSIGASTFRTCSKLTSITIPDGVTSIGDYAFSGCTGLKSITIPDSVTSMGARIFYNCSSLTKVTIPDGVTKISNYTFYNCSSLTSVAIPDDITSIGSYAFFDCSKLTSIDVPDGVTSIGSYAFYGCSALTSINIPEGVTAINKAVFKKCSSLTSITIPSGVTTIGAEAFYNCSSAESITIPEGVTSIGNNAFCHCKSITSIELPESLTSMDEQIFIGCTGLTSITIPEGVTSIGTATFSQCTSLESITISNGVTSIGDEVFWECTSLVSVIIPDSVTSIGSYAFAYCPSDMVFYVYPNSYAEEYAIENGITYVYISTGRNISLSVETEDGTAISDGYEVFWYEDGKYVGNGSIIYTDNTESTVIYKISLGEELSFIYYQPEEQTAETDEITCVLSEIPTVTLKGSVSDSEGSSVAGAAVTLKQTTASGYSKTVETVTDSRGDFFAEVLNMGTSIVVSADGYYNGYAKIISNNNIAESYDETEIVLEALPSNKITLSMYVLKTTDSEITTPLTNTNGLEFSLYNNTQGKSIDNFTIQYPYIILESGETNSGDSISVIAEDTTGSMTADEAVCTMDNTSGGEAEIVFLKNGYFTVNLTGVDNKTAMVFDSSGSFVTKYTTSSVNITSDSFVSGSYSIAIMEKTSLLPVVDSLSRLEELGFEQGMDYVLKNISIEKGTETDMGTVAVPTLDETKLYYTDSASLTANKTECPVGSLVLVTVKYDIQSQYDTSGQSVIISLPDGFECYSGSVFVNNETVAYTSAGNNITVNTNLSSATVRMYVTFGSVGECNINGFLSFINEGSKITQPIGGTIIDVADIEFYVPSSTSNSTVSIYGTAGIKSTITVYDNDVEVGTTTANSAGNWITDINLYKPGALSYHSIYITAQTDSASKITSDTKNLIYNGSEQGALSSITVYYTAHSSASMVFDYENGRFPSYYDYSDTIFSYEVKFTEDTDIDKLSDVYVVTMDSSKNITSIPCTYDSKKDRWICSYDYESNSNVPAYVTATYDYDNSDDYVEVFDEETIGEFTADFLDYQQALSIELEDCLEVGDPAEGDGYYDCELGINDESGNYNKLGTLRIEEPDYSEFSLSEMQEKGCIEAEDEDGTVMYYLMETDDDSNIIYHYVVPEDEAYLKLTLSFDYSSSTAAALDGVYSNVDLAGFDFTSFGTGVLNFFNPLGTSLSDAAGISATLKGNYNILLDENSVNETLLTATCKNTGEYRLSALERVAFSYEIQAMYDNMYEYLTTAELNIKLLAASGVVINEAMNYILSKAEWLENGFNIECYNGILKKMNKSIINRTIKLSGLYSAKGSITTAFEMFLTNTPIESIIFSKIQDKINDSLFNMLDFLNSEVYVEEQFNKLHSEILETRKSILAAYSECGEDNGDGDGGTGDEDDGSGGDGGSGTGDEKDDSGGDCDGEYSSDMDLGGLKTPFKKITPVYDPSGYVYEAVPSNKLNDVTVTVYYSESESGEDAEVWDAEDYDQTNPLTTDSNGNYAWDVPLGYWQVKYEKSGYTTAYSSWLPVPPPQFDVNQALVATTAPSVESVNVYEDEIQVIFSKYMKLSAGETITVTIDGEEVEGTVTASNAEYNGDETEEYASIFIFTPNENISGEATVSVAPAEGYNGLMTSAYSVTKTAVVRPRYINSADSITVKYNSGALLEVEILPNEAAEGLVLEASTASDVIATVTNETITLDSSGTANVMLNGELMGQTVLTLSIQGTDITKTVTVNVATNAEESSKCAKVTASIASGSTVEYGTELVLSTETDGAEIYYTLDGTCPCTVGSESRLLYTESLVLTEDTFIIAYAVKDGYEDSNTAGFIYTIADSGDDTTEESTEVSTETTSESTTETSTETTFESTTETTETSTEASTETSTETTTADSETSTTTVTESTTETTTKATSSSSSSGGGGGGGGSSNTCTIKLVPNNGVNASTKYIRKNGTLAEPDTPVYDGYTFTGWYTDSDCTNLYDFSAKVTSSFTLYGGWKEADENEAEANEIETVEEETVDTEESVFERIVKVVIGSVVVTVETDGQESTFTMDTAPYIQSESSSTLVPLRFVAVAVYGDEVDNADSSDIVAWDSATKTASITVGNDTISFTAGSEYMRINGKNVLMSNGVKAEITDGRMFIPFRALGEALGVEVDWDSTTKTAVYTTG